MLCSGDDDDDEGYIRRSRHFCFEPLGMLLNEDSARYSWRKDMCSLRLNMARQAHTWGVVQPWRQTTRTSERNQWPCAYMDQWNVTERHKRYPYDETRIALQAGFRKVRSLMKSKEKLF